ncbi:transcriptional regulator [Iodidimonas gelatinilytica]|uniref:Transcriptional regulator n=2 Tax=Iodidimonas TaxID=2066486 RepID=A0A5A7MX12_9PROT|nr:MULTISPECIES: metalloregulator ArsR/SmtB family transcription factor [Iodidimonas]GER00603.1 transcriptional regulator [Iodidimonas gelatinilytica]
MKINHVLKALSHPIRRAIIAYLRNGSMTAGALAEKFDVSKPTMSTHFAALKEAGLITAERDGVTIHYRLNATVAEEAIGMLMGLFGTQHMPSVQEQPPAPEETENEI